MAAEEAVWTISDKVCIVTGSNSGIGRVTAMELAKRGAAKVILACRNVIAAEDAAREIRNEVGYTNEAEANKRVIVRQLDLSSLESVRHFAADVNNSEPVLHVLINNAGLEQPGERELTPDGYEVTFATNHLGHFLLTNLLLDLLKKSAPSRIVNLGSLMYLFCWPRGVNLEDPNQEKGRYNGTRAYCQSKLSAILHARELHRRLNNSAPGSGNPSSGVSVFSLHPGFVSSSFLRSRTGCSLLMARLFFINAVTVNGGALTSLYCACQPGIEKYSGLYFSNRKLTHPFAIARDDAKAKALWELSEKLASKPAPAPNPAPNP